MTTEVITSLQNDRVKMAHSLQNRPRARRKEKKVALEGIRLIADVFGRGIKPDFVLYSLQDADYTLISAMQERKVRLMPVNHEVMAHVSDTQQPQGMVAVFSMPFPDLPRQPRSVLILDDVRDPGNMGTILRTAGASGVEVAVLSSECVDPYNPKVLRAGMGAHWRVPILEMQWFEIAAYVEGMDIYVAEGEAATRYTDVDFTRRWALMVGNEAHGVTNTAKVGTTTAISIPMAGNTESLNVAVATGVLFFEAQRQLLSQTPVQNG